MDSHTLELIRVLQTGQHDVETLEQVRQLLATVRPQLVSTGEAETLADIADLLDEWARTTDDTSAASLALYEAGDIAEKALGDAHRAADRYCALGQVLGAPDGITYLEGALNLMPGHEEALATLEGLLPEREHVDRLGSRWAAFVAAAPEGPGVNARRISLARAYMEEERYQEALECIEPVADGGDPAGLSIQEGLLRILEVESSPPPSASGQQQPAIDQQAAAQTAETASAPSVPPVQSGATLLGHALPPEVREQYEQLLGGKQEPQGTAQEPPPAHQVAPPAGETEGVVDDTPSELQLAQQSLAQHLADDQEAPRSEDEAILDGQPEAALPEEAQQAVEAAEPQQSEALQGAAAPVEHGQQQPQQSEALQAAAAPVAQAQQWAQPGVTPESGPPPEPMAAQGGQVADNTQLGNAAAQQQLLDEDLAFADGEALRGRFPSKKLIIGVGVLALAAGLGLGARRAWDAHSGQAAAPAAVETGSEPGASDSPEPGALAAPKADQETHAETPGATSDNQTADPEPSSETGAGAGQIPQPATEPKAEQAGAKPEPEQKAEQAHQTVRSVSKLLRFWGGTVDRDGVIEAAQGAFPQMERCYQKARKARPKLQGRVVLAWTIKKNGRAIRARRAGGTIKNAVFGRCLAAAIAGLHFPKPRGKAARVTLPFVFRREGL